MKNTGQKGFSLIELLLVVVIIGIIAAVAIPALQKGLIAAQNRNLSASLRSVHSSEVSFFSQNNRFGRLDEINTVMAGQLGTLSGTQMLRGKFVIEMIPATPTDAELKDGYIIRAMRNIPGEGQIYQYEITSSGQINRIFPSPEDQ